MNASSALQELEELAKKLDVDVQYHRFTGDGGAGGGMCRVKGQWRAILEKRLSDSEKALTLARCLSRFNLDDHFVTPAVRELLEGPRAGDDASDERETDSTLEQMEKTL